MSKKTVLYSNLDSSCIKLICSKLLNTDDSQRAIARQANVSARTVRRFAERLKKHGITKYSEIAELTPLEVYKKLYERKVSTLVLKSDNDKFIPDFGKIVVEMIENRHQSIKKRYEDYCAQAESLGKIPLCLSYFSAKIKQERDKLAKESPEFYYAQSYPYGLYAELDFTGDQYELLTYNGRIKCWIMVVAFPASYYVQAQFVTGQTTAESCRVLSEVFRRIGNRHPSIIKVDNAKCWSTKHQYGKEAVINRNFENYLLEMGICAEAAPPYSPQRKSCAEHSVNRVQTMMNSLKNCFSNNQKTITEHNKLLMQKIDEIINRGEFRRSREITREYLFKNRELPLLQKVSGIPDYPGDAISQVIPNSYMITVNAHSYSVPYLYIGKRADIYVTNDYIIIKHEGKEIARHLRQDGEGMTVKEAHRPLEHQEINRKNKLYNSVDDVLRISTGLDEGVYRFCHSRIAYDKSRGQSEGNTIKACRAVINAYKRCMLKPLFSEACLSVLRLDPQRWNYYELTKVYDDVLKEYSNKNKVEHQTEIIRISRDSDEAHIRDYEEELK